MSEGDRAIRFLEAHVVHPDGDFLGQPLRLEPWQRGLVRDLLETNADATRRHRRALVGLGRGNAKTTLMAGLALYELIGSGRTSPNIAVMAGSWEQANLLFGAARIMASESPTLAPLVDCQDSQILVKGEHGRLYRVAAVAGSNEGQRPSLLVADEVHELLPGTKERAHLVMSTGLRKRRDTAEWNITTAGVSGQDSIAERLYHLGQAGTDPSFLLRWWSADPDLDLTDPAQRLVAVEQANPATWLDRDAIVRRYDEVPAHEWERYHANRWTAAATAWLPPGSWAAAAAPAGWPDPGAKVVLGFDGSYARDCTAMVGSTLDGYVFVVRVWERPAHDPEWKVPRHEVMDTIHGAFARWNVVEFAYDPPGWHRECEELVADYGEGVVVEFPTNVRARMAEACSRFYTGTVTGDLSHDGSPLLARHLAQCVTKPTPYGTVITKHDKDSVLKIDAAVAAVVAYCRATVRREAIYSGPLVL